MSHDGSGGGQRIACLDEGIIVVVLARRVHGSSLSENSPRLDVRRKTHGSPYGISEPRGAPMARSPASPVILSDGNQPDTAAETPTRTRAMHTRILIADDNRDAADSMGLLLELGGHEVIVAHSGNDALALGRLHLPEVVILDIGMPDMSGYDVARTARSEEWGKKAFLIALTGWGQADDK